MVNAEFQFSVLLMIFELQPGTVYSAALVVVTFYLTVYDFFQLCYIRRTKVAMIMKKVVNTWYV